MLESGGIRVKRGGRRVEGETLDCYLRPGDVVVIDDAIGTT